MTDPADPLEPVPAFDLDDAVEEFGELLVRLLDRIRELEIRVSALERAGEGLS